MISKKTYYSSNGIRHRIVWHEKKMYLKCIRAVGPKTERQVDNGYPITCKNCLRGMIHD